jgi:hypothetical protein
MAQYTPWSCTYTQPQTSQITNKHEVIACSTAQHSTAPKGNYTSNGSNQRTQHFVRDLRLRYFCLMYVYVKCIKILLTSKSVCYLKTSCKILYHVAMSIQVMHISTYTMLGIMAEIQISTLCLVGLLVTLECDRKVLIVWCLSWVWVITSYCDMF